MTRRRTAAELERAAARAPAPRRARGGGDRARATPLADLAGPEALAMLVRRGLDPRPAQPDLPFPPELDGPAADALADRLAHYAFRLFLRGAILAPQPFSPAEATRYVTGDAARRLAGELVALGLAEPVGRGRYLLRRRAATFGGTLEWWVGRELRRRLGFDVATGVRSGAPGVGGDLDVVAAAEGKLVYVELKSSPPKHVTRAELAAFVRRVRSLRPDLAVLAVDTALRLGDRILPLLGDALGARGRAAAPRRLVRDDWEVAPRLYVVSAKGDLVENLRVVIADGLRALAPPPP